MRQNKETILLLKFIIHFAHIIVQPWTNAFAGSKKVFYRHYFTFQVFIGNCFAILINKRKRLYIADGWCIGFGKTGNNKNQPYKKTYNKDRKKDKVKNTFA